jgi:hypothetical protein
MTTKEYFSERKYLFMRREMRKKVCTFAIASVNFIETDSFTVSSFEFAHPICAITLHYFL